MNKKTVYQGMNALFLFGAVLFVIQKTTALSDIELQFRTNIWYAVPVFLFGVLLVHLFKMIRFYLVLLEQKVNFKRFVKVYLKTTFVNLVLPFKIGEVFRIYCFSHETNVLQIGLLSVVVDRFFDTSALLLFLVPYDLLVTGTFKGVTGVLLLFVVLIIFIYCIFEPTYLYLNKYLILNTSSRRAVGFLHILEAMKSWFDYIRDLVKGRYSLILVFSCLGWAAEFVVLWCVASFLNETFGLSGFAAYIMSIFQEGAGPLLNIYTCVSSVMFALVTIGLYILSYMKKRSRSEC